MATILVIEDSEVHRRVIREALEASSVFSVVLEARDGLEGLRLLMGERVDVVLLDLEMPGLDGEKLLRMKDASPGGTHIPFLFLTASEDLDRRARLLSGGAVDAIQKPFHPPELVARLRLHLKLKRLQDELLLKNGVLAELSSVDALTGLRSRRFVDEFLNIEFQRACRYRTPLAIMMADIDRFKSINDEHGHLAGDEVLRGVAALFRAVTRRADVAGRYGGEEFIVIGPQNDADGARVLAERLRELVEAERFEFGGRKIRTTLSLGVAQYDDAMGGAEDLIHAADRALYAAKQGGRNRIHVAPAR